MLPLGIRYMESPIRNSNSELLVIAPNTGMQSFPFTVFSVRLLRNGKYSVFVVNSPSTDRSERLSFMMQMMLVGWTASPASTAAAVSSFCSSSLPTYFS